jgi:hypothetical protein
MNYAPNKRLQRTGYRPPLSQAVPVNSEQPVPYTLVPYLPVPYIPVPYAEAPALFIAFTR